MAARTKAATAAAGVVAADRVMAGYGRWLVGQPLAARTRVAYQAQVKGYVAWLAAGAYGPVALTDPTVRDRAVRDYKRFVKTKKKWAPTSVNQALAAIDNFYRSLALGRPEVPREALAQVAPRSLEPEEQRAFLRSVQRSPAARDRAIALVFFYTAVRLAELAALDIDDVSISARRGRLRVRSGKGDSYREAPLNSVVRDAVTDWTGVRAEQLARRTADADRAAGPPALWLSRTGQRLGARSVDLVIRRLAADAGLECSAHVLRHTCVTNLIRSGADVVLVAEIAGHRRLDTTRRYSLPSEADRDAAVEAVVVVDP